MLEYISFQTLTWPDALTRVALALVFGFLLGLDRNLKNKPVDFRVYMIVAGTTCLLAIMGQELVALYAVSNPNLKLGLLRIVEGVLTGIGFLGAGAIIKSGGDEPRIIGTATGASIWSSGAVGLMLGFGFYSLALLGFAMLLIVLVLFGVLRKPIFNQSDRY
ncbi:MgtC/SapB family protein [Maritalea mediterranea]|uniref:Protein MgtC n=1 Tax=Maritalea mediterranea TaxID=2909667 RepID=A0ABS9E2Y9_9HYPH|nr:MgtC/SapB family protein [Maritalea mediterranea]MCF4097220.1 MgtC/SapB family protein [Maritalea mediterranea]